MKRSFKNLVCAAAMTFAAQASAQEASFQVSPDAEVVPGQFIVKLAPGQAPEGMVSILAENALTVVDTLPLIGAQIVTAPDASIEALQAAAIDGVAYIEPVYVVNAIATPNDPQYPPQWGFPQINAEQAWDNRTSSDNMVVAVIDTGVDYLHPDLAANMWTNPGETPGNGVDDDGNGIIDDVFGGNFINPAATGDPMDDNQHGTHVAGTIGAVTDNALGVAGVNWDTQIMALKFLSASGSGSTAGAIRAIEYAITMDADIMNNSWGGGGFSQALEDAITAADDAGILFVAAAGNAANDNDANQFYPASYDVPNVLAVQATDQADAQASFSNFGLTTVDLGAPGVGILSTTPGGSYASFNGTSMASPHVAGAAAMVWAEDPTQTAVDVKQLLMDTAEPIPALAGTTVTGARLDLAAALDAAGPAGCTGTTHAMTAYDQFFWSENVTIDQNDNLSSVTFTLPEQMVVDISADSSARMLKGNAPLVRTGVYNTSSPNVMWTGSYRRVGFTTPDVAEDVSTDFSIVLPAGTHTIWWKIWISNATLQFDSGALTVQAFPCSSGGELNLSSAATMQADTTQADPASAVRVEQLDTDASGASVTTNN